MEKEVNEVINGPRIVSVRTASVDIHVGVPVGIRIEDERKAAARYPEVDS